MFNTLHKIERNSPPQSLSFHFSSRLSRLFVKLAPALRSRQHIMESPLLSAPTGFQAGCASLSALASSSPALLTSTLREICLQRSPSASSASASDAASAAAASAAVYILRAALRAGVASAALKRSLEVHTDLSAVAIDALLGVFAEREAMVRRAASFDEWYAPFNKHPGGSR
jgi:hypothetical protein